MSRKTRKLIWSAPLVAVLAVAGALAAFVALAPNATQAHDVELPGAVSNLDAEADGTKAVDLNWDAPSDGGTPTGYRIDASGDGQTWTSLVTDTGDTSTSYRDDMIVSFLGSDRFYRVFAMNEAGTGAVSRTAGPVSVPDAGAPGDVTGISARAMGRETIVLSWSEPSNTGGTDKITKYLIAGATGANAAAAETALNALTVTAIPTGVAIDMNPDGGSVLFATSDASTSYTLEGLDPGQTWFFRIYAYNGEKLSAGAAETRSATTDSLGKIGPATGVTAVPDPIAATVDLYWYWPADDGGRNVTHWLVERKQTARGTGETSDPSNFNEWVEAAAAHPVDATQAYDYQNTGLTPGAKYQFRVTARTGTTADDVGGSISTRSGVSNTVTVNAVGTCPAPSRADADNPTAAELANEALCDFNGARVLDAEVAAARDGKGNVEVTVTRESPRRATSFRIDVSSDGNKWMSVSNYVGNLGSDDDFVYEYLDGVTGGDRHYRVLAYVGSSVLLPANPTPEQAGIKKVTAPGKVENLKASTVSQTQIDVTWSAPLKDGDAVVDMYCVQISDNDGGSFDALTTDTEHSNDAGTVTDPPDATTAANTAISLCARNATQDAAAGDADTFVLTDEMSYSHKKIKASTTRFYRVYGINNPVVGGDGRSVSSDTVSAKTTKQDKPGMPTGPVAEAAKDSNYGGRVNAGVYLLWNKPPTPSGGSVDSYVVQRSVDDGDWADLDADTGNNRTIYHDPSEPAEGEQRAYRVAAMNSSGTGGWSETAYYPQMPYEHSHNDAPMAPTAMLEAQSVAVSKTAMVASTITDPDGDTLTWTEMSDDDTIASSEVDDMGMVTITGNAVGTAMITVTATDADGSNMSASQTITVVVTNMAPTAEGTIANVDLGTAASSTMDVAMYFRDADDQMLTYAASSNMEMYATASIAEGSSMLTLTGVAVGSATITVTATDPAGEMATQTFMVTVTLGELGAPTEVTASLSDSDPGEFVIEITWVNGDNAEAHIAMLFDSNWDPGDRIATFQDSMDTTFTVTEPGTYYAVVVSVESREHYLYGYDTITVGE